MLNWIRKTVKSSYNTVGWTIEPQLGGFIWYNPETIVRDISKTPSPKALSKCPAVLDLESRYYLFRAPFDIQMILVFSKEGVKFKCPNPESATINPGTLNSLVKFSPPNQWRHPDRPIFQIKTPYRFVTDDNVYLSQLPPFLNYQSESWPGTILSNRFPLKTWPNEISWVFEWYDIKKPLLIKRGSPWFMVSFETDSPDKKVRFFEAERTKDLETYFKMIDGVPALVQQTPALFKLAAKRRPKKLLLPKKY